MEIDDWVTLDAPGEMDYADIPRMLIWEVREGIRFRVEDEIAGIHWGLHMYMKQEIKK